MNEKTLENLHKLLPKAADFDAKALSDLFDLAEVVDSIQKRIAELAERTGMPSQHFFLLEQLALSGGSSPLGDLLHILNLPKQSATYIVDRLEDEGYVERRKDKQDRRRYELALTTKGRRRVKADLGGFYEELLEALGRISQKDRRIIQRGLESFHNALANE